MEIKFNGESESEKDEHEDEGKRAPEQGKLLQVALFYAHICAYYSYARLAYIFI